MPNEPNTSNHLWPIHVSGECDEYCPFCEQEVVDEYDEGRDNEETEYNYEDVFEDDYVWDDEY